MNALINLVLPTPVANEKQMLGNSLSKSENLLTSSNLAPISLILADAFSRFISFLSVNTSAISERIGFYRVSERCLYLKKINQKQNMPANIDLSNTVFIPVVNMDVSAGFGSLT